MNIAFRAARAVYRGSGLKAKILDYAERQKAFLLSQQQTAEEPLVSESTISVPSPPSAPSQEQIPISDIDGIDRKLNEADDMFKETGQFAMSVLASFVVVSDIPRPEDPFSPEYRDWVMTNYEALSGKKYSVANEGSPFDVPSMIRRPFPYMTQNYATVADQMLAWGHIVRTMALPPGASILEFGPGWGSTSVALAAMGYDVTAIEIEPNFCEVIKGRAAPMGVEIKLLCDDFMVVDTIDRQFDALLFFESFHHCADHHRLMAALDRVVKPGGKIFFAAEPIWDGFHSPWGVRLDGFSVHCNRKYGWLELGFTETYFHELGARYGWRMTKVENHTTPIGKIMVAERMNAESHHHGSNSTATESTNAN